MVGARSLLLLFAVLLPLQALAEEPTPEPEVAAEVAEAKPKGPVQFRADFKAGYALTDGAGLNDHIGMEVTIGPQIGRAVPGGRVGLAPIVSATIGIAEGGNASLRIHGGLELAIGVAKDLELVPVATGGYLQAFDEDLRAGPMLRVGLGFRILGDDGFYLGFEPISLVVLPPPPGGFTRYTSHVALDMGVVKFGGRGP